MAQRDPLEPLAKQPAGMRLCTVIVVGKRPVRFVPSPDMPEISPFRGIAAERPVFALRFGRRRIERDLAAACRREAVRVDPAASEIIGGEFPDRQPSGKTRRECVCRIVVLVPTLEGRDPQRLGAAARNRNLELVRRGIEIDAQTARRGPAKQHRLQPKERRRRQRLLPPASHPPGVCLALPRPQRGALRHSARQIKHEDPGPGLAGPQGGNAAGDDLVIGMRRQDEDPARVYHARLPVKSARPPRLATPAANPRSAPRPSSAHALRHRRAPHAPLRCGAAAPRQAR